MSNYQRFMKYFPGHNTFQVFGDSKDLRPKVLQMARPVMLTNLNQQGYGIFLTINETDGKGRGAKNIIKIRAVYADLDGVLSGPMMDDNPHLVVESSKSKFHGYWFVDDKFPLEGFTGVQKSIAHKYGSDPAVNDLSRVMRVPGFMHLKKEPYPVRVAYRNPEFRKMSYGELVELFPPVPVKQWSSPKYNPKSEGNIDVGSTIPELLLEFGWTHCRGNYFTRPGKKYGISGVIMDSGLFWPYTSSTCLEPRKVCDAFELFAQYKHSGDKRAAMLALKK